MHDGTCDESDPFTIATSDRMSSLHFRGKLDLQGRIDNAVEIVPSYVGDNLAVDYVLGEPWLTFLEPGGYGLPPPSCAFWTRRTTLCLLVHQKTAHATNRVLVASWWVYRLALLRSDWLTNQTARDSRYPIYTAQIQFRFIRSPIIKSLRSSYI